MTKRNGRLAAALAYLRRGWSVVPVCPPDHVGVGRWHARRCASPGKAPLVAWAAFQERPPSEALIEAWWAAWPNANVGLVLGPASGLVGIDIDGPEGGRILEQVSRGQLPRTLAFATARGRRLLYAIPEGVAVVNRAYGGAGSEVRVLARGSLTVMPPSLHASGKRYRWLPGHGPDHVLPAPAPGWVVEPLPSRARVVPVSVGEPILEGQRNTRLFRIACALRRHGCAPEEILCAVRCVNQRCRPPLEEGELRSLAWSASRYLPGDRAS
jgi:hypothetical protein